MFIQDQAYDGSLRSQTQLDPYLSAINEIGGNINLTPLCAACRGGNLETVKLLLANKADPNLPSSWERTPLFFITDADDNPQRPISSSTRCAIIRELVSGKSGAKADIDAPCDDDKNTPLMNAILQIKDEAIIRILVECNASTTVENSITKKTAKDLAEDANLSHCLRTKADLDALWEKLINLVVSFVLLVISYVNNKTANRVVNGIVKQYYDISIKEADVPKKLQEEVAPKSTEEFKSFLDDQIKQDKTFQKFFSPNDPFLKNLATKANALKDDPTTDLGKPENIVHLTKLSLYHPFIYCDDSGSMRHEDRYEYQIELVKRIARIATKIVPDELRGVDLRFINNDFDKPVLAEDIEQDMRNVRPSGRTNIGTNLRTRILEPFVYELITKPVVSGAPFPFKRPLLVCIITDGTPEPEGTTVLRDEIMACKEKLTNSGYDPTAVKFCISQVGTSQAATEFIDGLRNEKDIEDVIHCTVGQLDSQFKELKDNEKALESWLLHMLTMPIMERDSLDRR